MGSYHILIVDDDPLFLALLDDFLSQYYRVSKASGGRQALEMLENQSFDLVLSDIDMPEIMGYELLSTIRKKYPGLKTAIITAWSLEDYIQNILEHDIGNIISKTVPFNFDTLHHHIDKLLTEDLFGLEQYMEKDSDIHTKRILGTGDLDQLREEVLEVYLNNDFSKKQKTIFRLLIDESVYNAIYHPNQLKKGDHVNLRKEEEVKFSYSRDSEKIGFAVSDPKGLLTQKAVLSNFNDCIYPTEETLYKQNGRGMFLMHSLVDRMIINIKRNQKTEVILLIYTDRKYEGHRPILIHEI